MERVEEGQPALDPALQHTGILFSGIQPSGEIHIGNYCGAIRNWVQLLDRYRCIFSIVDYHAITVTYEEGRLQERIRQATLANIAAGLDPDRCLIFVQSQVPEHTELTWIFNTLTPMGLLSRMTQFKEKSVRHSENVNVGLFDYPVLQAADVLLYRAEAVPVGEDQVQHIELTRDIARKFNLRFGPFFPEPEALVPRAGARILGLDGKAKMSKSLGNYIGLLEEPDAIWEKLRPAVTDENRKRRSDPGNPEICNIHTIHTCFSPPETIAEVESGCRSAGIGCIDCKRKLFEEMKKTLDPIRARAADLAGRPGHVDEVLAEGARRCRELAGATMEGVRERIGVRPGAA
ncbi:MAG: tryptophan--tRNA ligase [Candidatus Eisenbacteria bacterium]|nr:tryptophan--tRNA ligase [Candidatus Eisenbacteria bacterium]